MAERHIPDDASFDDEAAQRLLHAFAAAPVPGDDPAFLARVHGAIGAAERQRRWRRSGLALLIVLCAIVLTPAVVELSLALAATALSPAGASIAVTLALCASWLLARPALR